MLIIKGPSPLNHPTSGTERNALLKQKQKKKNSEFFMAVMKYDGR